jgi:hypothetical protein
VCSRGKPVLQASVEVRIDVVLVWEVNEPGEGRADERASISPRVDEIIGEVIREAV